MILGFLPLVKAAMTDSIYLHGAITNTYKNAKYVSIKDTFDQEYLLPISLLEKKLEGKSLESKTQQRCISLK
jgi:hypothetical protein